MAATRRLRGAESGKAITRKTASDFHPEVLKLFDVYVHGGLNRRQFLDRAAPFTAGTTVAALLAALIPNYA